MTIAGSVELKTPNKKHAVKAEISMKTKLFNDTVKRSAFPPASGRMTSNTFL